MDFRFAVTAKAIGPTRIWDLATGQEVVTPTIRRIPQQHGSPIFCPDGTLMGNRNPDGTLSILDTSNWEEIGHLSPSGTNIKAFVFSPDGASVVAINQNNTVTVWDATTGTEQYTLSPGTRFEFAALSADGKRLAVGAASGAVTVWDTESQQDVFHLGVGEMNGISFSSDTSRVATLHRSGEVQL
jgi:WD40 repeat protein